MSRRYVRPVRHVGPTSYEMEEKVNLEIGGKGPSVAKVSKIGVREE